MWYCSVSKSKESDHFGIVDLLGEKYYVARKREYVEALTGEAKKLDRETAEALEEKHGIGFTAFVVTSKYRDVSEDEPEKVTIETHTHWADSLMGILNQQKTVTHNYESNFV